MVIGDSAVETGEDAKMRCAFQGCQRIFEPVRLTNFSCEPQGETYSVCPYCFSRVDQDTVKDNSRNHPGNDNSENTAEKPAKRQIKLKDNEKTEGNSEVKIEGCQYTFGYLKDHQKKDGIPDECLTCKKMLQCILSSVP